MLTLENECSKPKFGQIKIKYVLISSVAVLLAVFIIVGCVDYVSFSKKPVVKLAKAFAKNSSADSYTVRGDFEMSAINLNLPVLNYELDFDTQFEYIRLNKSRETALAVVRNDENYMTYSDDFYSVQLNGDIGNISKIQWKSEYPSKFENFCDIASAAIFKDYGFIAHRINNSVKQEIFVDDGFDECLEALLAHLSEEDMQKVFNFKEENRNGNTVITSTFNLEELLIGIENVLSDFEKAFKEKSQWEKSVKTVSNIRKIVSLLNTECMVNAEFYIDDGGYLTKIKAVGEYEFNGKVNNFSFNGEYSGFGESEIPTGLKRIFDNYKEELGKNEYAVWDKNGFCVSQKSSDR